MQTKSTIARIAAAVAIAVILPLAILITILYSGKKTTAQTGSPAAQASAKLTPADTQKVMAAYGKLPMSFEPNQGQTAPEVKFVSHGPGYDLFLTGQEAVMAVRSSSMKRKTMGSSTPTPAERVAMRKSEKVSLVRLKLKGANADAQVAGNDAMQGKVNYLIGNDSAKWHTDVPTYARVKYSAVYPGIDLVYYGNQKQLEYDFVVAPGADPKAIAFDVNGAKALRLDNRGNLVMKTAGGDVTLQKPFVYQEVAGQKHEIAGNYVMNGAHEVGFTLGAYDTTKALTIDPSVLIYSTYLGGSGANGDLGYGIALDTAGDAFVTGWTSSADFPKVNNYGTPANIGAGVTSAFVTEVNPAGTSFIYSTYLGGSGTAGAGDGGDAIAVDASGHVFVSGFTESSDFPVTATTAFMSTAPASVAAFGSGFITELNPATSGAGQLLYSTYLGGSGTIDETHSIATDGTGKAYATGVSDSLDFPTLNPLQATPDGSGNAYLTEIDTTKSGAASLIFSTVLGGSGNGSAGGGIPYSSVGFGIKVDAAGHTYVAGSTPSTDFAPTPAGGTACGDGGNATAFLVEVDTTKSVPTSLFSLCLGGATGDTIATSVAIAPDNTAGITGQTFATDFAVTNTIPIPPNVPTPIVSLVFAAKINTTGGTPVAYSTIFGGNAGDNGYGIAFDSTGNMYIGGETQSGDFPNTQGALQVNNPTLNGTGFITKLNPAGSGAADIIYSTYFGGAGSAAGGYPDSVNGIAVPATGTNAYITGQTASANSGATPFPITTGAPLQNLLNTTANAFVAELPLTPTISISPVTLNFGTQLIGSTTAPQFVTITNNTNAAISLTVPGLSGTNPADFAIDTTAGPGSTPCTTSLAAGTACTVGVTFTPSVAAAETATLTITDGDDTTVHELTVALSGTGSTTANPITLSPTSLTFAGTLIGDTSAGQVVTVTNNTGSPVTITSITPSVASFTESDSCTDGAIPANGTCAITVKFAPASGVTPGSVTGTLTVTSGASTTSPTVALTGTAWDFTLTVPATETLARNSSTTFTVPVTGLGGFTGSVAVACSSSVTTVATCSVSGTPVTPGGSATVTVTSGSGSGMLAPVETPAAPPTMPTKQIVFAAIAMLLLFAVPMTRQRRTQLGLVAAMVAFTVIAGCSGTPKQKNTTLTITGTSGDITKTYTTAVTVN